ncbi:MAG: 4-alpha-glucanotransferase, partial [Candidatus Omnitrophica bacterium]|nr:4-alpha-glucanotransferase [Candidatus Omnitrophota bacterium]
MSIPKANLAEYLLNTASGDKWKGTRVQRRSGISVPLFSVYSQESVGIGEFADLKLLLDWANQTGNSIIQLLPMNEVGSLFCPYDSISSFALEPAYISFREIPQAGNKTIQKKIKDLKKLFCAGKPYVNYAIKKEKIQLLREAYEEETDSSLEFKRFPEDNVYWLPDFALYKALKGYHKGLPWYEWDVEFKERQRTALETFQKENARQISFQMWVQWLSFRQFKAIKAYAKAKKVLLKGDLPILVSRDSADVWAHPEFFKLGFASGAPPDMYCALGQRWGMPTYNWDNIAADGFRHLKEKLKV